MRFLQSQVKPEALPLHIQLKYDDDDDEKVLCVFSLIFFHFTLKGDFRTSSYSQDQVKIDARAHAVGIKPSVRICSVEIANNSRML